MQFSLNIVYIKIILAHVFYSFNFWGSFRYAVLPFSFLWFSHVCWFIVNNITKDTVNTRWRDPGKGSWEGAQSFHLLSDLPPSGKLFDYLWILSFWVFMETSLLSVITFSAIHDQFKFQPSPILLIPSWSFCLYS